MAQPRKAVQRSAAPPVDARTSDRELVAGIRRASEAHFNQLYARYFQRVYSFTQLRMRDRADAEEVVQEVFTSVFRSIEGYRGQSSLAAWIYGIAKNTVNNHIRRAVAHEQRLERAESGMMQADSPVDACTPEEFLQLRRCGNAIEESLSSMADWHVEAFVLRHFENLSIDEISRRVSRSNDAVRSSLYRTKKMVIAAVGADVSAM